MTIASTFDALAAARNLEAAGIERRHAEAFATELRAAAVADRDDLATKGDIAAVKGDIAIVRRDLDTAVATIRADLYRALWIQGGAIVAIIGGFIAIAAALKLI